MGLPRKDDAHGISSNWLRFILSSQMEANRFSFVCLRATTLAARRLHLCVVAGGRKRLAISQQLRFQSSTVGGAGQGALEVVNSGAPMARYSSTPGWGRVTSRRRTPYSELLNNVVRVS